MSTLPQVEHTTMRSLATCAGRRDSGAEQLLALLDEMQRRAPRRARPEPGRRASSWIRRSISGPATDCGAPRDRSEQLQPRRQRQALGDARPSAPARRARPCRRASFMAATMRSSRISFSSGFDERGVDAHGLQAALGGDVDDLPRRRRTSPRPRGVSSSACTSCTFCCIAWACFMIPSCRAFTSSTD